MKILRSAIDVCQRILYPHWFFFPSSIWEMHPQWSQIRHVIDIPLTKITHRGLYIRSAIFTQPNVVDGLGLKRFVSIVLSQLSASYFSRHLGTSHAIDLVIRSAVKHYRPAIKLTLLQLLRYALGKWLITIKEFANIFFTTNRWNVFKACSL